MTMVAMCVPVVYYRSKNLDFYSGASRFKFRLGHPLFEVFRGFLSPSSEILGCYLDFITTTFFLILSNSPFVYHPPIRQCIYEYIIHTEKISYWKTWHWGYFMH
jgi:hypothetical protein